MLGGLVVAIADDVQVAETTSVHGQGVTAGLLTTT